jgi:hypothetical protein
MTPRERVFDYGPTVIEHHGDSLWDGFAKTDYYFLKETRTPRVAWRFLYTDGFNHHSEGEDFSDAEACS